MKRSLAPTVLLATMFVIAACSGGEPQDSEQATPSEPRQTRAASAPESVPEETAQEEPAPKESPLEKAPAEDEAAESERENPRGGEEAAGLSVTTIEGEEISLGGQGDVTAIFFMAGW